MNNKDLLLTAIAVAVTTPALMFLPDDAPAIAVVGIGFLVGACVYAIATIWNDD